MCRHCKAGVYTVYDRDNYLLYWLSCRVDSWDEHAARLSMKSAHQPNAGMWWVFAGQAVVSEAGRCCPLLSLEVGWSLILPGVHVLTTCFPLRVLYVLVTLFLRPWVTISDSTIFFGDFFRLLIVVTLVWAPFTRSFFWVKSSQGHSQASGQHSDEPQRTGLWVSFHLWWFDVIALFILGSGIKLSLHLHLCLVGCSRVCSLNGSAQIKIQYHSVCKHQPS